MGINLSIEGIQEAQQMNNAIINALRPNGLLGSVIQGVTIGAHRYAVAITHVITGTLRASHRTAIDMKTPEGKIFVDPASVNPRSQSRPEDYIYYEEKRGGSHAVYTRTEKEVGERLAKAGADMIRAKIRRPV